MKKLLVVLGVAGAMLAAEATVVSVTNVVSRQRYPWNGLVDIDYELVCEDAEMDFTLSVIGHDRDRGRRFPLRTITGDGVGGTKALAGKHRLTWDMTKDAPSLVTTNFVVDIQAYHGLPLYMVIDTSCGYDSNLGFPITYLDAVPDGGWTDEYKTTKIVLRRIDPGSFIMGSPETELGHKEDEVQHPVTITKPYYIGVFEVTCWQWCQVMATGIPVGSTNCGNEYGGGQLSTVGKRPRCVSYDAIRGNDQGNGWPQNSNVDASSFLGRLRGACGLSYIDLPTESQWEYACRAGTSTSLNDGNNLSSLTSCSLLSRLAVYASNTKGGGSASYSTSWYYGCSVGTYECNAYGLYDMHGNLAEWCLDYYGKYESDGVQIDPRGSATNDSGLRVTRGGYVYDTAENCRSAARIAAVESYCSKHPNASGLYANVNGCRLVVNIE